MLKISDGVSKVAMLTILFSSLAGDHGRGRHGEALNAFANVYRGRSVRGGLSAVNTSPPRF
jgi:hypothetical protein